MENNMNKEIYNKGCSLISREIKYIYIYPRLYCPTPAVKCSLGKISQINFELQNTQASTIGRNKQMFALAAKPSRNASINFAFLKCAHHHKKSK